MGLNFLKIYLDSCILIYLIEEHQIYAPIIEQKLSLMSNVEFYFSDLSEMECYILPIRLGNRLLLKKYKNWFDQTNLLSLEKGVFRIATQLRADFRGLKTPDALHIATALHHNCDEFWTNDNRLNLVAPNLVKNILLP